MGSAEEAPKFNSDSKSKASKKLEFDSDEPQSSKDPLENGLEDYDSNCTKSSSEKDESDEDGNSLLPLPDSTTDKKIKKSTPSVDIQKARARNDSEGSYHSANSPSTDRMKR